MNSLLSYNLSRIRMARWGTALLALAWLAFGVSVVSRYGMAVDSPALFYSGDRTLFWLEHRHLEGALDLKAAEPKDFHSPYGREPAQEDPYHYPVFPSFVAALTAHVVSIHWHWLPDLDGRHLGLVLLHIAGLVLFTLYACRLFGTGVGLTAGMVLALYPSAIASAFNNPKDWPSALYYGVGVLAAGVGLVEGRARHLLAAGILFGISLSSKLNGAFGVATVVLGPPWPGGCSTAAADPLPRSSSGGGCCSPSWPSSSSSCSGLGFTPAG